MIVSKATLVDFVAGWCAGGAAVLACQPLDTVLTRFQAGPRLATGTVTTLVQQYGWTALWRGSSCMIGAVPFQNALLMGGYGIGKRWTDGQGLDDDHDADIGHGIINDDYTAAAAAGGSHGKQKSLWSKYYLGIFCGGCVGGVFQSFLMSPVEMVKVTQQVSLNGTVGAAVSTSVGTNLFRRGWWSRGLNATLWRDGLPHGVWFVSYEYTKCELGRQLPNVPHHQDVTVPLLSGAVAATVAWTVGYPFDVIKTRIQASTTTTSVSMWRTALELIQERPGGLYQGFGLKLLRSIPSSMIGFLAYEQVSKALLG